MKTSKRIFSGGMAVIMLVTCLIFSVSASGSNVLSQTDWNAYWQTVEGDNTMSVLTPGSDISCLNVSWHSDSSAITGVVRISKSRDMHEFKEFTGASIIDSYTGQRVYQVTVSGLEENTVYYYTYGSNGKFSAPQEYRTLSADEFKVLYISDIQIGGEDATGTKIRNEAYTWQKVLGTALDNNDDISFIISAGDQTQNGDSADEWIGTLSPAALRSYPMATVVGNHDKKGDSYTYYVNNPNEYRGTTPMKLGKDYWFRYGDVLFLVYNTQCFNMYDQYHFTQDAIAQNEDATWRIAIMHHDIYGTGHHAADNDNAILAAAYSAILDKFEIDVCLTGHEHLYGRSYFMENDKPIKDQTYDKNGAVIDPEGIIYFTANSASNKQRIPEEPYDYDWLEFSYITDEPIYSTIEFSEKTFTLKSYTTDSNKLIDECKIVKTDTSYTPVDPDYKGMDTNMLERCLGEWYIIIEVLGYVVKAVAVIAPKAAEIIVKAIKYLVPIIIDML